MYGKNVTLKCDSFTITVFVLCSPYDTNEDVIERAKLIVENRIRTTEGSVL
ncbi:hypothetical protein N007_05385 [Alicyclobacillus acidoterrestris ATCC 49025]|nr:hypothetical protein N007_05385 [Alicyclobacillus acidoterrestris ATCC 49025]